MPISRKTDGLRSDGFWAGAPTATAFENIAVPTLILSCEDDLFGTADTARLLADRIPARASSSIPTAVTSGSAAMPI
jgi:2-hydroxy-6-oxonona-2,4-dienedioate hydrolase